jgi:hypothetical protein
MTTTSTSTDSTKELPPGTSPQWASMHKWIRRVCYVLLFGLVFEGALTFPLLAIWYGFPSLNPVEVCSELQKVMYSDGTVECDPSYPLGGPPFGGVGEGEGQKSARDQWGINPKPEYPTVDYRELVRRHDACEEWRESKAKEVNGQTVKPIDDYCNYVTPGNPAPPTGGG